MDFEWRKAGVAITQQDFGRVLAGQTGGPQAITLHNTSTNNWTAVRLSLVQGDSDGGYGTASAGAVVLDATPRSVGALAAGAFITVTLGWTTPAGTVGRVGDLANLTADYDY